MNNKRMELINELEAQLNDFSLFIDMEINKNNGFNFRKHFELCKAIKNITNLVCKEGSSTKPELTISNVCFLGLINARALLEDIKGLEAGGE